MDLGRVLFLDIETPRESTTINRVGALRPGRKGFSLASDANLPARLSEIARGAEAIAGHNLLRHDLPILKRRWPKLPCLSLPTVDTLELSPLALLRGLPPALRTGAKLLAEVEAHFAANGSAGAFRERLATILSVFRAEVEDIQVAPLTLSERIFDCRKGKKDDRVELPAYWTLVPELTLRRN